MDIMGFYRQMGVQYDDVLRRLISERLIVKYLGKMLEDPSFEQLTTAITAGDAETAFRAAHTIKGMCLNLDLHPLLESSARLTDLLRNSTPLEQVGGEYRQVAEDYCTVMQRIRSLLEDGDRG